MDTVIRDIVLHDFNAQEAKTVLSELSSIGLNHMMAASEYNLKNTRLSILKLAKGDLMEVKKLTKIAKIDFRDIIVWAAQEK